MDRDRTVKTATARATEAIEAAEMMFADEMGATLDLSPAARMALIEKIAAAIQTAVAEAQQKLEFTDEEVLAFLNLLNHAIESGRLPPSPRIRTLRAIGAKFQTTLFRSLTAQTADAEVG
jgi:rhamnose utilization protein RhaD (predicted bifunctional aldolase and dehydrogenase)